MTMYFAQLFSLCLVKSDSEVREEEKSLPNPENRYFIYRSELGFMSSDLKGIREMVQEGACDWPEGGYYTHAVILKMEEGYCPIPKVVDFYDLDTMDEPSQNWRKVRLPDFSSHWIYRDMSGKEIAINGDFGIESTYTTSTKGYTFICQEEREDEIIYVDKETGKEIYRISSKEEKK